MSFRILCAIAILALAGCASRQAPSTSDDAAQGSSSNGSSESSFAEPSSLSSDAMVAEEKLKSTEPSVYFEYDKFILSDRYMTTVQAFTDYLRTHPGSNLLIEGNCDERGTIEYNLALGQKRADAVKDAVTALGIRAERIETISNGEEKPRNTIKSEAGYSVNRRADLIIR